MPILHTIARLLLLLTLALDTSGRLSAMPLHPAIPAETEAEIGITNTPAPCHETIAQSERNLATTAAASTKAGPTPHGTAALDIDPHHLGTCGSTDCQCGCLVTSSALAGAMNIGAADTPAAALTALTRVTSPTAAAIPDLRPPIRA